MRKSFAMFLIVTQAMIFFATGCNDQQDDTPKADTTPEGSASAPANDPLKQAQDEGKLPKIGTGSANGKLPVLNPTGGGDLSMYPVSIDPDQDNVPNSPVTGHPEIAVDNCPSVSNPGQEDADHNGVGDACQ